MAEVWQIYNFAWRGDADAHAVNAELLLLIYV